MGKVISIAGRMARRQAEGGVHTPPPVAEHPSTLFFFDLACPLSYLAAERVERELGEITWLPARLPRREEDPTPLSFAAQRERAERLALALRLPLVWPEGYTGAFPGAMRVAAWAAEQGAGSAFALAALRLVFCGGFDLERPATLAEAVRVAGLPVDEARRAQRDPRWDEPLASTGAQLQAAEVRSLPAFRVGSLWLHGLAATPEAAAMMVAQHGADSPLAPTG